MPQITATDKTLSAETGRTLSAATGRKLTATAGKILAVMILGCFAVAIQAQVEPSPIIRSGMVIQRNHSIPLWGTASSGSTVFAELNGQSNSTTTDLSGKWEIGLPPMNEGGPHILTIGSGEDTIRYTDVYIGDVWLASGQSNMQWELSQTLNAEEEIAGSDNQQIRQFLVKKELRDSPTSQISEESIWTPATNDHVGNFTAVGYYFAKYLNARLGIPIGIINASYGGTRIESWMSKSALGYDETNITFGEGENHLQPTLAYNAMLRPLVSVPLKGIIWYQGESNMGSRENALMYSGQLKQLITSWRDIWSQGEIPFIWVQIPNTGAEASENSPGTWDALPMLRAAQSRVLDLPGTGEATTIDTGEPDIHPRNKEPVGERLSLVARTLVYGDNIVSSGPRYESHRNLDNGRVEISFSHVGGGLVARESGTNSLRWFSMAGSNGIFYPASAQIENNKVIVWNNSIPNPEVIRYAWEYNPFNVNFFNQEGLPAVPFKFKVKDPGFGTDFFKATRNTIDKGESVILTWQVSGAGGVSLDQIQMDTIGGIRVWPGSDSTFTLRSWNRRQPEQLDSVSITIRVIEPIPTIILGTDAGNLVPVGSEVKIHATVSAPLGGTISQVRFFVNGEAFDTIYTAPFETIWVPGSAGRYALTGLVMNDRGITRGSDTVWKEVDWLKTIVYEAEDAEITGGYRHMESDQASGGRYVELSRDWTINFPQIELDTAGDYQLTLGYMLSFGSPKIQHLIVNGVFHSALVFESQHTDRWEKFHVNVPLEEGTNQVMLGGFWDLMSLDYLALFVKDNSLSNQTSDQALNAPILEQNIPNPVQYSTSIGFTLPENGFTILDIYDLSGKKLVNLVNRDMEAGRHVIYFSPDDSCHGFYIIRLKTRGTTLQRKMVIQ